MKSTRRDKEVDADLYSTHILDQLLQSHKEWKEVEEIVPLTFKAVVDMLATQSQAIKDIKAVLTTRASKTELTTGLALKSNVSDVSKAVEELSQALEERPTFTEMNSTLRQYATKTDLGDLLSLTQTHRNMAQSYEQKENIELTILKTRMDEFQKELTKKVSTCATLTEFNDLTTLLESKANITQINEALQQKVSKQYLMTALQKKANKSDVDGLLLKKADTADLDYLMNSLESKVNVSTLDKLTHVIDNKADKSQLVMMNNERSILNRSHIRQQEEEWIEKLEHARHAFSLEVKQVRKDLQIQIKQNEGMFELFRKEFDMEMRKYMTQADTELNKKHSKIKLQTSQQIQALRQVLRVMQDDGNTRSKAIASLSSQLSQRKRGQENIYSEIDQVRKKMEEGLCKMVSQRQFIDFKSQITGGMESKVEIEQVQRALDSFQATINVRLAGDRTENLQEIKTLKDLLSQYAQNSTADLQQLRISLTKKQERGDTTYNQEGLRKIRREIDQCRKTVDLIYNQVQAKLSIKEYETDLIEIRKRFESLSKEVGLKANIKDVCVLADSKPNIDDVNNALRQINDALSGKVNESDLDNILKDLATVNETLCTENIVGRWMWHSGQMKPGSIIPWESESTNTVPDYYFWEKDKTSILVITAGVYQITACIFSKNASVTIMANGQTINTNKGEENHNNLNVKLRRRKDKGLGSSSVTEYLLLPARSRISIANHGEGAEGFLNIRRF